MSPLIGHSKSGQNPRSSKNIFNNIKNLDSTVEFSFFLNLVLVSMHRNNSVALICI